MGGKTVPTIVELLGLHGVEFHGVGRFESERVESEVARRVVSTNRPSLDVGVLKGRDDGQHLDDGNGEDHGRPKGLERSLLEGGERGSVDAAAEERMKLLGDGEAEGGQHGNAAVLDLHFPVEADFALGGRTLGTVFGGAEASRVKEPERLPDVGIERMKSAMRDMGRGCANPHGKRGRGFDAHIRTSVIPGRVCTKAFGLNSAAVSDGVR